MGKPNKQRKKQRHDGSELALFQLIKSENKPTYLISHSNSFYFNCAVALDSSQFVNAVFAPKKILILPSQYKALALYLHLNFVTEVTFSCTPIQSIDSHQYQHTHCEDKQGLLLLLSLVCMKVITGHLEHGSLGEHPVLFSATSATSHMTNFCTYISQFTSHTTTLDTCSLLPPTGCHSQRPERRRTPVLVQSCFQMVDIVFNPNYTKTVI